MRAGLEVTIRRSKTDQEAKGALLVIPYGSQLETCPGGICYLEYSLPCDFLARAA